MNKRSVFSKLESILAGVFDFTPASKTRRSKSQGWNNEAKAYLRSIGYSDEIIDKFYAIITQRSHKWPRCKRKNESFHTSTA